MRVTARTSSTSSSIEAKKQLDDRKYADALKLFDKIDKTSTQYEEAQQQARMPPVARQSRPSIPRRLALAKNDNAAALDKVPTKALTTTPRISELQELKNKPQQRAQDRGTGSRSRRITPPEPTETPKKSEKAEPKNPKKSEPKKSEPKKSETGERRRL